MLYLSQSHDRALKRAAIQQYPEECCGLLLGRIETGGDRRWVLAIRPLANQWQPALGVLNQGDGSDQPLDRRRRYWIDPQDLFQVHREARDRGWDVIGVYHSHPDHVAQPSERDRAMAWEGYSYPILSVQRGRVVDVQSWRLQEEGQFRGEPITVTDDIDIQDLELR